MPSNQPEKKIENNENSPTNERLYPQLPSKLTPEELIKQADAIKESLAMVFQQNDNNLAIKGQLDLLKKKKLFVPLNTLEFDPKILSVNLARADESAMATPDFIRVMNQVGHLLESYQKLKKDAVDANMMSEEEANSIERAALNQNENTYFPLFQSIYDKQNTAIQDEQNKIKENVKEKIADIHSSFGDRMLSYFVFGFSTGLFSLLVPELLPIVIGTAVVATIDAIITCARAIGHACRSVNAEENAKEKITAVNEQLNTEIEKNPLTKFKQRFFQLGQNIRNLGVPMEEKEEPRIKIQVK